MSENLPSRVKNVRGNTELMIPYCLAIAGAFLTPVNNKKPFGWRNVYTGVILTFFLLNFCSPVAEILYLLRLKTTSLDVFCVLAGLYVTKC